MKEAFESVYHAAEDTNWWFKARQDFVGRLLKQRGLPSTARILDIGCGGGGMLSCLQAQGFAATYGTDRSQRAVAFCRARGLARVYEDDAQEMKHFTAGGFDVIIASDILEHLPEPQSALMRWRELLADHGILILFVPAFKALWSERDVLNEHRTRFTRSEILKLADAARLRSTHMSYWNCLMFLPYLLIVQLKKLSSNKIVTLSNNDSLINRFLKKLMRLENTLILSGIRLPVGVSFVGLFQKK